MKTNNRTRRGFTLVELLVVIVIIAALAGLTAPMVIRQRKKADQTEAVNNARQIGLALFEFETEYSKFPDAETATAVAAATETTASSGLTANDRFRQLIRSGIAQSEAMFYAKTAFTKKPDGIFNDDTKALEPGEVGFGIVTNSDGKGLSAAGNPSRPIVAAPFTLALDGKFDGDFYDGKAVILKLDNSVTSLNIVKSSGRVLINGKEMLTTGPDTVWGTDLTPQFAFPQKKQ
jgi:prepilin-type N-terminal cleavage/methylation domain-containing protein